MKSLTHNAFSAGLGSYVVSRFQPSLTFLIIALWLALVVNLVIDGLGHTRKDDVPVRSALTHSIFSAPLWGVLIGILSICISAWLLNLPIDAGLLAFCAGLGAFMALTHLFLDSITGAGVFVGGRRFALAHLRYDNPFANAIFTLLGLLLLVMAVA